MGVAWDEAVCKTQAEASPSLFFSAGPARVTQVHGAYRASIVPLDHLLGPDRVSVCIGRVGVGGRAQCRGRALLGYRRRKRARRDPWRTLSDALRVDYWIDGARTGDTLQLNLSTPDGEALEQAEASAGDDAARDALAAERMWSNMGPHLSAREARSRKLQALTTRARAKLAARDEALSRQRTLGQTRKQAREERLKAAHTLAAEKHAARSHELTRVDSRH